MSLGDSFCGKHVLITGGGRGIGRKLVERLVQYGAKVFVLEHDENLVDQLKCDLPQVHAQVADIAKWKETQELIHSLGPIDHLVNNAVRYIEQPFLEITEESLTAQLDVNIKGLYCVAQAVAKSMIEKGGTGCTIVNMASMAGVLALDKGSAYSVAKAGVIMFTKSLALELGKWGIRVNCISPTAVSTPLFLNRVATLPPNALIHRQPLAGKKVLELDEIVDSIVFLLSPLSSMTNGHNLVVDGGVSVC